MVIYSCAVMHDHVVSAKRIKLTQPASASLKLLYRPRPSLRLASTYVTPFLYKSEVMELNTETFYIILCTALLRRNGFMGEQMQSSRGRDDKRGYWHLTSHYTLTSKIYKSVFRVHPHISIYSIAFRIQYFTSKTFWPKAHIYLAFIPLYLTSLNLCQEVLDSMVTLLYTEMYTVHYIISRFELLVSLY